MKFTLVAALLSVATSVSATSELPNSLPELFSKIPSCADKCVADAMPGLCPSVESYWCRCHNSVKGRLMSKTFDCAIEACGSMEAALEYQDATNQVCDSIKEVTLNAQKHVELRQAVGSGSGSLSYRSASGSSTRGSTSRAITTTAPVVTTSLPPSNNAPSSLMVGSTAGNALFASVAGLAIVSFMGMLI